jgi:hypothetical protein
VARRIAAERHATVSSFETARAPGHVELPGDAATALRRYGASVDLLVLGSHKHHPPDRHLERSKSQRLAEDPASPLLVLASAGAGVEGSGRG